MVCALVLTARSHQVLAFWKSHWCNFHKSYIYLLAFLNDLFHWPNAPFCPLLYTLEFTFSKIRVALIVYFENLLKYCSSEIWINQRMPVSHHLRSWCVHHFLTEGEKSKKWRFCSKRLFFTSREQVTLPFSHGI